MEFLSIVFCILFVPLLIGLLYVSTKLQVSYLTSQRHLKFDEHQRIVLSIAFGLVVVGLIVRFRFPNSLWHDSLVLSGPLGFLVGLLGGVGWQLGAGGNIPKLFRNGLLISGFLALLLAILTTPGTISKLKGQKNQIDIINSFSTSDISYAKFRFNGSKTLNVNKAQELKSFKKFLADAELSAAIKKADSEKLRIEIQAGGDSVAYDAFIPTSHPDDIMLKFATRGKDYVIRLPGLKRWLDENILKKEK